MDFICPVCKKSMAREVDVIVPHMEAHIVDAIKKKNPQWVEKDGACRQCLTYFKEQMRPK